MKLLVLLVLVSGVAAAPQAVSRAVAPADEVQLLRFESDNDGLGTYRFAYAQSDGQKRKEEGELKHAGTAEESIVVRGSYSWLDPEGVLHDVMYIADENGFLPTHEQGPGGC